MIDASAWLGSFPFRKVPGTSPEALLRAMDRCRIERAWVSHLPGLWWKDPMEGNRWLFEQAERQQRFEAVAAIHPGLPGWEDEVTFAVNAGAAALRADPCYYGIAPDGAPMRSLAERCAASGIPLVLTVRIEDQRQRHPLDLAAELPAAAVRALVRAVRHLRLLVTHAERSYIEEVHFGLTPAEAARVWWDICWIWGPPEDHLATLCTTIGPERFVFGTGQPLRLPENGTAKLDLLDLPRESRARIEATNLMSDLRARSPAP